MNDPETQAQVLAHLLSHRPECLERKPVAAMREDEEDREEGLNDEWKAFLIAFGRTVPADTPPLPVAEARYLRLGPDCGNPVVTIDLCVMLARARLREGLLREARGLLRRAQRLLAVQLRELVGRAGEPNMNDLVALFGEASAC
jgi:hypothetical protein